MKREWRKHLTDREATALARLEARIKRHEEALATLRPQRLRIQNRATARAK
jgi:hypothetical protein